MLRCAYFFAIAAMAVFALQYKATFRRKNLRLLRNL
jgi:hypothetical protein